MANRVLIVFVSLFTVVYVCDAQSQSNSSLTGTTSDGSSLKEKTPLEKGAASLFDLTHSFLDSVQSQDFIAAKSAAISFEEVEQIIRNGTYGDFQKRWQDLFKVFGGYAACIILGLLFVIVMPIVGMFFCCCYCCCKCCGKARSKEDPPHAKCKRMTYTCLLAVMVTMMLAGGIVAIISNQLLHTKLTNSDERGPYQYIQNGLRDLEKFTGETKVILKTTTGNTVNSTVDNIIKIVNDTAKSTVDRVMREINAEQLLQQTDDLGKHVTRSLDSLKDVKANLDSLNSLTTNISQTLTEIGRNISTECNNTNVPSGQCPSGLSVGPDFSQLSNLSDIASNVESSVNVSQLATEARAQFDATIAEVNNKTASAIDDAKKNSEDIKKRVAGDIGKIDDTVQPFVDRLRNLTQDIEKENTKLQKEKYLDYWWYGGIGVPCLIILIVLFYYMGILFGICGERPGRGAPCCNRGAGSSCLVAGVVFTFFFSWILMLICTLLFIPGGLLYTNLCRDANKGVENIGKFEDILDSYGVSVKDLLYEDKPNATFTISDALKDCKDNKALYTALKLENLFNIDTLLDPSTLLNEVNKLAVNGFTIGNVTIIPSNLNESLSNFANSGILSINFTQFDQQLGAELVPNLTNTITTLEGFRLTSSAQSLKDLQGNQLANLTAKMNELRANLKILENNTDLQDEVKNLTDGLQQAQDNFNSNGNTLVQQQLNATIDDIKGTINRSLEEVKSKVRYDIGKCRPVYVATQKLSDAFCLAFLDPYNSFWFGVGWGIFFFIPSIIFALLLANMYQREDPLDKETWRAMKRSRDEAKRAKQQQDFEHPEMDHYQGYGRAEDNIPLTSVDRNGYHGNKGIPNAGYRDSNYPGDPYYRGHQNHPPSYQDSHRYPSASHEPPRGRNDPYRDGYGGPRDGYRGSSDGYRAPSSRTHY